MLNKVESTTTTYPCAVGECGDSGSTGSSESVPIGIMEAGTGMDLLAEVAAREVEQKQQQKGDAVGNAEQEYYQIIDFLNSVFDPTQFKPFQYARELRRVLRLCEDQLKLVKETKEHVKIDCLYKITAKEMGKSIGKLTVENYLRNSFEISFIILYYLIFAEERQAINQITFEDFWKRYPEFHADNNISKKEMNTLCSYFKTMKMCQRLITPKNHKNHLMAIVTRMVEGAHARYVVGSGQSDKTSRRVLIYRREGNVPLVTKPTRSLGCENDPAAMEVLRLLTAGEYGPGNMGNGQTPSATNTGAFYFNKMAERIKALAENVHVGAGLLPQRNGKSNSFSNSSSYGSADDEQEDEEGEGENCEDVDEVQDEETGAISDMIEAEGQGSVNANDNDVDEEDCAVKFVSMTTDKACLVGKQQLSPTTVAQSNQKVAAMTIPFPPSYNAAAKFAAIAAGKTAKDRLVSQNHPSVHQQSHQQSQQLHQHRKRLNYLKYMDSVTCRREAEIYTRRYTACPLQAILPMEHQSSITAVQAAVDTADPSNASDCLLHAEVTTIDSFNCSSDDSSDKVNDNTTAFVLSQFMNNSNSNTIFHL